MYHVAMQSSGGRGGGGDAVIPRRSDWCLTAPAAVGLGAFTARPLLAVKGRGCFWGSTRLLRMDEEGLHMGNWTFLPFQWALLTAASAAAGFLTVREMGSSR